MAVKIYEYQNCSTCKKALQYLDKRGMKYEKVAIVENPPSVAELKKMAGYLTAAGGSIRKLFNVSGQQYRALKISEKLAAGMSDQEIFELLAKNGKLIKRPFLLTPKGGSVGFDQKVWDDLLSGI